MSASEDLEVKIAFMDDLINSLNETVYQQQRQIDRLHSRIETMSKQLKNLKEANNDSSEDPPPPHY